MASVDIKAFCRICSYPFTMLLLLGLALFLYPGCFCLAYITHKNNARPLFLYHFHDFTFYIILPSILCPFNFAYYIKFQQILLSNMTYRKLFISSYVDDEKISLFKQISKILKFKAWTQWAEIGCNYCTAVIYKVAMQLLYVLS